MYHLGSKSNDKHLRRKKEHTVKMNLKTEIDVAMAQETNVPLEAQKTRNGVSVVKPR